MLVQLTHIDGKLPNLALMKLSHWHKAQGDTVFLEKSLDRQGNFDRVYGSCIFTFSNERLAKFQANYPEAVIGGTGTPSLKTVEDLIGEPYEHYDYSIYPEFEWSIGYTQRGCRLSCKFCVVPQKEGKPVSVNSIHDIWRPGTKKNVMLLDNDFFGQPKETLTQRINELIEGNFKVCFNQGINIRLITDEAANWLAKLRYFDDSFASRRLYTAWDNLKDEQIFFRGVDCLRNAGVPPKHLMVYMLIGYAKDETWEQILYRFNRMVELGIKPYPMVYNNRRLDLKRFQKWAVRRYYQVCSWEEFKKSYKSQDVFANQGGDIQCRELLIRGTLQKE